jgi:hypothetical protein
MRYEKRIVDFQKGWASFPGPTGLEGWESVVNGMSVRPVMVINLITQKMVNNDISQPKILRCVHAEYGH